MHYILGLYYHSTLSTPPIYSRVAVLFYMNGTRIRTIHGQVLCGFNKLEILGCGSVRFADVMNPTVRFCAVCWCVVLGMRMCVYCSLIDGRMNHSGCALVLSTPLCTFNKVFFILHVDDTYVSV